MKNLELSYKEYESYIKYILVDDYMSSPWEDQFSTLDEVLECLDDRFIFNEESNNKMSKDDFEALKAELTPIIMGD